LVFGRINRGSSPEELFAYINCQISADPDASVIGAPPQAWIESVILGKIPVQNPGKRTAAATLVIVPA
jgi:hypothetical protein